MFPDLDKDITGKPEYCLITHNIKLLYVWVFFVSYVSFRFIAQSLLCIYVWICLKLQQSIFYY